MTRGVVVALGIWTRRWASGRSVVGRDLILFWGGRSEVSRWAWHHRGRLPSRLRASARDEPRPNLLAGPGVLIVALVAGWLTITVPGSIAKASARRSVSRVLSHDALRRRGDGHPSGAVGRPTAHAADPRAGQRTSSPADVARRRVRPPIWPCSGWSLPVSLRSAARAAARHRHCGTGPRLTAGGRYPPPCAAELGLSSRRRRVAPPTTRDHPTASLTGPSYSAPRRQAQLACCGATSNVIEPPLPSKIIRPAGSIETDDAPCMAPMNRPSIAPIAGSRQAIAVEPIVLNLMAPRAYS